MRYDGDMSMLVIGLVGEKGSGKGTFAARVADIAKDKCVVAMRFSDLLRETLDAWSIPTTRRNLQLLAEVFENSFGMGTLSHAVYEGVMKIDADVVILDGVRWETDAKLIRSFPQNKLLYITAPPAVRYERSILRGENVGEKKTTLEQFMEEEQAVNEILIPRIGATADHVIRNDGTMGAYNAAIDAFCLSCGLK